MSPFRRLLAQIGAALAWACAGETPAGDDAGIADATIESDAGAAATNDAGGPDAGGVVSDAGEETIDAGAIDAGFVQPPLWELARIRDASTADCRFTNQRRVTTSDLRSLDVWDVSYLSWESIDGVLKPIRIKAFAARPAGASGALPGVVNAHGLGGFAKESNATEPAARTGTFVLAYTGPGGGTDATNTSEGLPAMHDSARRLFDTVPDLRGTWFWGHAMAAMRGLTCLSTRTDVDANRLGMTGFSAGAVATLIVAGVDDWLKAAVPISGTHAWRVAVESPQAWQHELLKTAGYTTSSPEWVRLQESIIDPAATVAHASAKVLMVNGTTDEFFPLTAHTATFDAIPGADKRTSLVGNFDHGCYSLTGIEPAGAIEARAELHVNGALRLWFSHWFGLNGDFAYLPAQPSVQVTSANGVTALVANVDAGGAKLEVDRVDFWFSQDAGVFAYIQLDRQNATTYGKLVGAAMPEGAISYVDVTYRTRALIFPEKFALSSRPDFPAGFVPRIRAQPGSTSGAPCQ